MTSTSQLSYSLLLPDRSFNNLYSIVNNEYLYWNGHRWKGPYDIGTINQRRIDNIEFEAKSVLITFMGSDGETSIAIIFELEEEVEKDALAYQDYDTSVIPLTSDKQKIASSLDKYVFETLDGNHPKYVGIDDRGQFKLIVDGSNNQNNGMFEKQLVDYLIERVFMIDNEFVVSRRMEIDLMPRLIYTDLDHFSTFKNNVMKLKNKGATTLLAQFGTLLAADLYSNVFNFQNSTMHKVRTSAVDHTEPVIIDTDFVMQKVLLLSQHFQTRIAATDLHFMSAHVRPALLLFQNNYKEDENAFEDLLILNDNCVYGMTWLRLHNDDVGYIRITIPAPSGGQIIVERKFDLKDQDMHVFKKVTNPTLTMGQYQLGFYTSAGFHVHASLIPNLSMQNEAINVVVNKRLNIYNEFPPIPVARTSLLEDR